MKYYAGFLSAYTRSFAVLFWEMMLRLQVLKVVKWNLILRWRFLDFSVHLNTQLKHSIERAWSFDFATPLQLTVMTWQFFVGVSANFPSLSSWSRNFISIETNKKKPFGHFQAIRLSKKYKGNELSHFFQISLGTKCLNHLMNGCGESVNNVEFGLTKWLSWSETKHSCNTFYELLICIHTKSFYWCVNLDFQECFNIFLIDNDFRSIWIIHTAHVKARIIEIFVEILACFHWKLFVFCV